MTKDPSNIPNHKLSLGMSVKKSYTILKQDCGYKKNEKLVHLWLTLLAVMMSLVEQNFYDYESISALETINWTLAAIVKVNWTQKNHRFNGWQWVIIIIIILKNNSNGFVLISLQGDFIDRKKSNIYQINFKSKIKIKVTG